MMIMEELNEIRMILEAQGEKDKTKSQAWSEVMSHGVMGGVSAVKQRAKTFRKELEYLRKQLRQAKMESAVRKLSSSQRRDSAVAKRMMLQEVRESVQRALIRAVRFSNERNKQHASSLARSPCSLPSTLQPLASGPLR